LEQINEKECASRKLFLSISITMHGSENANLVNTSYYQFLCGNNKLHSY